MSPLGKTKTSTDTKKVNLNVKPYILPVYIVLSAIFILYITYGFLNGVIYRGGFAAGQQNGYDAALGQLIERAGTQCEPVTINYGENAVNVINVACLQAQPQQAATAPAEEATEQ